MPPRQQHRPNQKHKPQQRKKPMPRGEGYREVPREALEAALEDIANQLLDVNEAYLEDMQKHNTQSPRANGDHLNNFVEAINRLSELAAPIRTELDRREAAESKKTSKENEYFDDLAEIQVEGMQEEGKLEGDALGDYELKAQNALNRATGKAELDSFNDLWKEAWRKNRKFDRDQKKEKDQEGLEKEGSVIAAHQEAFREGDVEKNHRTFGDLYDEAHKENDKRDEIKDSTEYQTEQAMQEILSNIDKAVENRQKVIEKFENKNIWSKMRHPQAILDNMRNKRESGRLGDLKTELLVEESGYADKKQTLADERVTLEREQIDGGGFGPAVIEQMEDITMRMKILEKTHEKKKEDILDRLEKIGINVSSQRAKEVEINLDSVGTNSNPLTGDERSWKRDQEDSVDSDPYIQSQIKSLKQELKDSAIISGPSGFGLLKKFIMNKSDAEITQYNNEHQEKGQERRDNEIKSELDKYKQKIVEARLRRKRMEEMIKAEQQKNPIDINNALIIACSERIVQETQTLEAYSEDLREKVIAIGWKSRVRRAANKPGAVFGKARERIGR